MTHVILDGKEVTCQEGDRILDVARRQGTYIPTLCFDERLAPFGACRVCLVGVQGARGPVAACTTPVRDGMVIDTADPTARRVARGVVELVLSDYPPEALSREGDRNELRQVARHFGLDRSRYAGERHAYARDDRHPYLKMDLNECIVCGRCVRACDEIQGTFALAYAGRGFATKIVAGKDSGFLDSPCVSCGACVSTCPTGALDELAFRQRETLDRTVTTTCSYCGVGCSLDVHVRDDRVVAVDPALDGPSNKGHTCVKGRFAHQFATAKDRLTTPLIRRPDGTLREASWDEALGLVAGRLREIRDRLGPDAIAGISSSRCTNEENYTLMKMMRAAVGTNNVDNCSRVCHSPSSFSLIRMLGLSGGTNSFDDIERCRTLLVTGANPTEAHPVVGARMKEAVLRGANLIVIDPRRIELSRYANLFLQLEPGSNVALFSGLCHVILRDGLADAAFLAERTEGAEAFAAHMQKYTPQVVSRISGVPASEIERAAHLYASAGPSGIFYGLGVTEHRQGAVGVQALINLAALTGNLGRRGAGVNPLRGQNNVQGGSDMGALPNSLTMYRGVNDPAVRAAFEARWGVPLPSKKGLMIPEMFDAALRGALAAIYCFGEDIAQTDPNSRHVEAALSRLELLVVHDIFQNATARFAHVILPGSSFLEKTGTFTNAERRIQLVNQAVPPPGEARHDLWILQRLTELLGYPGGSPSPAEVMDEIAALTPELAGVSHARLGTRGLQWPVPAPDHPGTEVLYEGGRFRTPSGRARLQLVEWVPPGEAPSEEFPLVLITGRALAHYNSGTMTRRTENVRLHPEDLLEVHAQDAERLGLRDGDFVEVTSARGSVQARAWITDRVAPGHVFLAFHFPEMRINVLTSAVADGDTSCPEYKVTAVRVSRAAAPQAAGPGAPWPSRGMRPGA
jgi:formate dehydrogenase alpha subunit